MDLKALAIPWVVPAVAASILGSLSAPGLAAPIFSADRAWGNKGGWQTYWSERAKGCFSERKQAGGGVLVLGFVKKKKLLAMGLFDARWDFVQPNRSHPLRLNFDKKIDWTPKFTGMELAGRKVLVGATGNKKVGKLVASSSKLRVVIGKRTVAVFSLKGSSAAMKAAAACHTALFGKRKDVPVASSDSNGDVAEAKRLHGKAHSLYQVGNYEQADPLFRRAIALWEKAKGPDHPYVAVSLNSLARLLYSQGDYAAAVPIFRRALAIREKAHGPAHPDVAVSLNDLAVVLKAQGDFAGAETLHRRSLAIYEKHYGADHANVAGSLNNLAELLKIRGDLAGAEPVYRRSLALREKALGPEHADVAQSLNNLGDLLRIRGALGDAEPLFRRALAIRGKALGPDHPDVAASLGHLALLLVDRGDYTGAEPLYRRALAIREKTLGRDHPFVASNLNNLAILHWYRSEYSEAELLYRRALAIKEKALGPDHFEVAMSLNNLALVLRVNGDIGAAKPLHRRSLAIQEKVFGPDHPAVADAANNLADLLLAEGDHAAAEPLFRRSLAINQKVLGPAHPHVANNLNNLASVLSGTGDLAGAYEFAHRAAAIHQSRALVSNRQRNGQDLELGTAGHVFHNVVDIAWKLGLESPEELGALTSDVFRTAQLAGRTATGAALNQMAARFGAGNSELSRLVRQRQDLINRWQVLNQSLIQAVSETTGIHSASRIAGLQADLDRTDTQTRALDHRLERDFPEFAELSNPRPLDVEAVQKLLGPDEALLTYLAAPQQTFILAVTREGVRWKRSELGDKALAGKVQKLRAGLDLNNLTKENVFDLHTAHSLYSSLLEPVSDLIGAKTQLLIVASGPLTSLPFHLLVTEDPKPAKGSGPFAAYREAAWLVRRFSTTTLPSVSSLKALRVHARQATSNRPFIGYGDPIFNRRTDTDGSKRAAQVKTRAYSGYFRGARADLDVLGRSLGRLADTENELRSVARSLGAKESDIILRADATERAVKRASLDDYRIIHFATHALVAGQTRDLGGQAEPALALTLPKEATDEDDGLLLASEVAQLKLNADWVVLSACNTAAGDKPGAEALSGLARAFFYAGTRALLVTHWDVNSAAAVKLTSRTFELMKSDPEIGRAEALRLAMLELLEDTSNPTNPYPAIWAPFVVIGEGGRSR